MLPEVIKRINTFEKLTSTFICLKIEMVQLIERLITTIQDDSIPLTWIAVQIDQRKIWDIPQQQFTNIIALFEPHIKNNDRKKYSKFCLKFLELLQIKTELIIDKISHDHRIYDEYHRLYRMELDHLIKYANSLEINSLGQKERLVEAIFDKLQKNLFEDSKRKNIITKTTNELIHLNNQKFINMINEQFKPDIINYMSFIQYELSKQDKLMKKSRRELIECVKNQWSDVPVNVRPDYHIRNTSNDHLRDISRRVVNIFRARNQ